MTHLVDATHKFFEAADRSYHALIKKEVHQLALAAQFTAKRIAELDIVVSEITSNFHKHASCGELLVGCLSDDGQVYLELICIDQGPGMSDIHRMMADGYSSKNTMGHGLGSIRRLVDVFDIFSLKDWGTILLVRIYRDQKPSDQRKKWMQVKPLVIAKPKEIRSGDGYYVERSDRYTKLMLADGLGHGIEANIATNEAIRAFKECPHHSPAEIIRFIHPKVRKTRGLVATIAVVDHQSKQLHIAGVGNISAKLTSADQPKKPLSYNGIIGHNIPNTIHDQTLNCESYHQLILCSDGIRSQWELKKMTTLARHDLSIQAAAIYKDYARRTDDMSIVIAKFNP